MDLDVNRTAGVNARLSPLRILHRHPKEKSLTWFGQEAKLKGIIVHSVAFH
jgi:hypothetical protein